MLEVVWLKRDLRIADHAPLSRATAAGPTLILAPIEPDIWTQPDMAGRHYAFWTECLEDLRKGGVPVCVRVGAIVDILSALHRTKGIRALWSHEETGNGWTYARDRLVARWCRDNAVDWHEIPQFGVERGGVDRDRWAKGWERFMAQPLAPAPQRERCVDLPSDPLPSASALGLSADPCPGRQQGGRSEGLKLLESFLEGGRGATYQRAMSSPLSAATACSRLSPHFAYGSLSLREVVQRAYDLQRHLGSLPDHDRPISAGSLRAFIARLHWHCHFIQKLESEPAIEHRDLHPAFRGARTDGVGHPHYEAWATGQTGFPFVDACMRSLIASGWINFRMRAMLVAFASYHLWLDWRATGTRLAQLFTDYEPGIHWPQVQMQSGSTAINTPRLYNPVKQSYDQDPDGLFIRQWVPELSDLTGRDLHEPWTSPRFGARAYPAPIIDHIAAAKDARRKLTGLRATPGFYAHQKDSYLKHGSRRSSRHTPAQGRPWKKQLKKRSADQPASAQLELKL